MICNRMSNLLSAWIKYLREDPRSPNPETPPHAKICHDMPHVLLTCVHLCATCTCEHDRASIESKDDIQNKKLPTSHRPSSHIQHHRGDKTDSPTIAPRQNTWGVTWQLGTTDRYVHGASYEGCPGEGRPMSTTVLQAVQVPGFLQLQARWGMASD